MPESSPRAKDGTIADEYKLYNDRKRDAFKLAELDFAYEGVKQTEMRLLGGTEDIPRHSDQSSEVHPAEFEHFFRKGRVFMMNWIEDSSYQNDDVQRLVEIPRLGLAWGYRRFIVIGKPNADAQTVVCCPVTTYNGKRSSANIIRSEHGYLYSGTRIPYHKGMVDSLKIQLSRWKHDYLEHSLINHGTLFTVNVSSPLLDLGLLDSSSQEKLVKIVKKIGLLNRDGINLNRVEGCTQEEYSQYQDSTAAVTNLPLGNLSLSDTSSISSASSPSGYEQMVHIWRGSECKVANVLLDSGNKGPNLVTDEIVSFLGIQPTGMGVSIVAYDGKPATTGGSLKVSFSGISGQSIQPKVYTEDCKHVAYIGGYDMVLNQEFLTRHHGVPPLLMIRYSDEAGMTEGMSSISECMWVSRI